MMVTLAFVLLALLSIVGAAGLLFLRKVTHCAGAFLLCCVALAGLYLLLNLSFLALVQLWVVFLMASLIVMGATMISRQSTRSERQVLGFLPVALLLSVTAFWAITQGELGEPVLQSTPMWAVRGEHIAAFGQELLDNHLVPVGLVGLFLLTSIVSISHVIRSGGHVSSVDELDRQELSQ
jgi:NADH-quinone oxidoreductase subunit J